MAWHARWLKLFSALRACPWMIVKVLQVLILGFQMHLSKQQNLQIWNLQIMSVALYLQLGEGETFERAAGRHKHGMQNQGMTGDLGWLCPRVAVCRWAKPVYCESFFSWSVIALQCCVGFCYTTKWVSYMYMKSPPSWTSLPTLSHSSRCHRALNWAPSAEGCCSLAVLHIVVYICHGRNSNNLRYADDTTLMAEKWRGTKEPLDESERGEWKSWLKAQQKTKIMAFTPITSWQIDGEIAETVADFIFLDSKITSDGDCSHEIKRHLFLGRKAMTHLDSILKSRDIETLLCQQRSF